MSRRMGRGLERKERVLESLEALLWVEGGLLGGGCYGVVGGGADDGH